MGPTIDLMTELKTRNTLRG